MTDKFEDFMDRLEMPLPEPKLIRVTEKVSDVNTLCMGFACICVSQAINMAEASHASIFGIK